MTAIGQMVILGCGEDLFAVPVERVQEILDLCPVAPLPRAPRQLLGVIDVRGESVPVADLRAILDMALTPDSEATRIVVLWLATAGTRSVIALKVDRVIEIAALDDNRLDGVPEAGLFNWRQQLIAGIGRREGRFVTVLHLDRMLDDSLARALPAATEAVP